MSDNPHHDRDANISERRGRPQLRGARFFCLLLAIVCNAAATELDAIRTTAAAGAPTLALRLLDRAQPPANVHPEAWTTWERERVRLLEAKAQWPALAERLASLPPGLDAAFYIWAKGRRIHALLESSRAAEARDELAAQIWRDDTPSADTLAQWRRQIIRSYLVEGRSEDAFVAMMRYRQDYGDEGEESIVLRARVLLTNGLATDAAHFLERYDSHEAQALRLLARLRAGQIAPRRAKVAAESLARQEAVSERDSQLAWAVAAEAAVAAGEPAARVIALEMVLGRPAVGVTEGLAPLNPDALWDAYVDYAVRVGNREQLLLGDDAAWFAAAARTEEKYPIRIRSLYALLALRAADEADRERAHGRLIQNLLKRGDGMEILRKIYLSAKHFAQVDALPVSARRVLTDEAIKQGDLALASRLQAGLNEPPEGTDHVLWQLRRAKIFILGGQPDKGVEVLRATVPQAARFDAEQVDRLVQVLFDLQTLKEHEAVVELFDRLSREVHSAQLQREFLYWMADSRFAQERYVESAALYLRSATLLDTEAMDPWAQTARYQAAKALAQAELVDDAGGLLEQLLGATADPARRAVLQRDLQQLWLKR